MMVKHCEAMPDCNSGIRVKFVGGYGSSSWGGGGGYSTNMDTRRVKILLKCFPTKG